MAIEVRRDLATVFNLGVKYFFAQFMGKFFCDPGELASATDVRIRVDFNLTIYSESRQSVAVGSFKSRAIELAHGLVHLLLNFKGQAVFQLSKIARVRGWICIVIGRWSTFARNPFAGIHIALNGIDLATILSC